MKAPSVRLAAMAMGVGAVLALGLVLGLPHEPGLAGPPKGPPKRPVNLYTLLGPDARAEVLYERHARGGPFPVVLERVSRGLLGAAYRLSPLGEGPETSTAASIDPDPRFRLDQFDCTTFVETSIALGYTDDFEATEQVLDELRYSSGRSFETRRHFMTAQWIPELIEDGVLEDITRQIGKDATETVTLRMSPKRWKSRRVAKSLDLPEARIPSGDFDLDLLPVQWVLDHLDQIPPATVLHVVRQPVPWSPVIITHQGLVLTPPSQRLRVVRHASPVARRVVDEPLESMMRRYLKPRKWPILGIHVSRIRPPGP